MADAPRPAAAQLAEAAKHRIEREKEAYEKEAPDERPLGGYLILLSVYCLYVGVLVTIARLLRPELREGLSVGDLALAGIATHKLSRIATKDPVTSPFRAAFTSFSGPGGEGEVMEEARGEGVRHAVGELVTCPFCLGQWIATFVVFAFMVFPREARWACSVFATVALSDILQIAYANSQELVS